MACSKIAVISCSVHFFSSSVHLLQYCDQFVVNNVSVDSDDNTKIIDIIATGMHLFFCFVFTIAVVLFDIGSLQGQKKKI